DDGVATLELRRGTATRTILSVRGDRKQHWKRTLSWRQVDIGAEWRAVTHWDCDVRLRGCSRWPATLRARGRRERQRDSHRNTESARRESPANHFAPPASQMNFRRIANIISAATNAKLLRMSMLPT